MTGVGAEARGFRYRPGLDGVRALAVGAVILYHGDVSWAKGGFLGVDVFFVLSGYLITSLLLRELEHTGGIALAAFWTRRVRRLLPALFLVLAAVALYAVVWAQPTELTTIRGDGLASLFYVSNWRFIASGASYFQAFRAPSPLTHTWSLAIEEQWYLFWPLAMLLMMRVFRGRTQMVVAAIVGLAICSAAAMAVMFHPGADPSRVYYGTDTRAQALLVGAAFAALTSGLRPAIRVDRLRRPWILQVAGITGAAIVATMVVRVDSTGAFLYRGGFLLAAVAAVLFVGAAAVDGPVASVLSIKPLVAVGMVSYGLYLWHWPVDVLLDEARTGLSGYALFALRIAVTGMIATASYFLVERPIRRNGLAPLGSWARARLRPAIVVVTAALLVLLLVVSTEGATPAPSLAAIAKANQLARRHRDPSKTRVLMLGDSQLLSLVFYGSAAFANSGSQYQYRPILGCGVFDAVEQVGGNCAGRARMWNNQVRTFNPDLSVLLIGAWETLDFSVDGHTYVHGTLEHERELERLVTRAIRPLTTRHGKVALLEVPCFAESHGDAKTIHDRNDPSSIANVNDALRAVADRIPSRVTFVPWADAICPGGRYVTEVKGVTVRHDGVHVSSTPGADLVTDRIVPILSRLAREARDATRSRRRRRREGSDGCVRRRRDRRRLGGRGARGPAVGGSEHVGAVARGRPRPRLGRRARGAARPQLLRRGLRAGPHLDGPGRDARAGPGRGAVRARARRGRVVVGERDGRHPGNGRRLRALGGRARLHGLGLAGDARRVPARRGRRSTTAATGCTARAVRSRSSRLPFDALPPLDRALRAAMTELGYPVCDDYHAPDATGVSRMALTIARRPSGCRRTTRTSSRRGTGRISTCAATCSSTGCSSTAAARPACAPRRARRSARAR